MKGLKPKKVEGSKPGEKVDDYWDAGRGMLADPKFLESLYAYDRDNIEGAVINRIQPYIAMKEFQPDEVAKVSKACTSLCLWVRAMEKYHWVNKAVQPKRARLREAQAALDQTLKSLNDAKWRLREVENNIEELEQKYDESAIKKEELAAKVAEVESKLERAQKLISHLGGEKDRWQIRVKELEQAQVNMVGDLLVAAGSIAYIGPFTAAYRHRFLDVWREGLAEIDISFTPGCTLHSAVSDPVSIRQWIINGLPRDTLSIENAIIVSKAHRWPLFIDPQRQANKWVRNTERELGLDVLRQNDANFVRNLENSVQFGKPVLLENVGQELETVIEPVLQRQVYRQGGQLVIKIGDSVIPYHSDFRLYITSRMANPDYKPETSKKVSLLNFALSPESLEDQLLSLVVAKERPDLEEVKSQLVLQNAKMHKDLNEIEDKILQLLAQSEGNILEDEVLIETLSQAKRTSQDIEEKMKETEQTEREIDETRNLYRPVARRASVLYFCIADLTHVDPMYQYSLDWFVSMFSLSIDEAERSAILEERLNHLCEHFTASLYTNVCRSLFEKHKLLFSFLLCIRILQADGQIDEREWRFLLTGSTAGMESVDIMPNPAPGWLTDKSWGEFSILGRLPAFQGLDVAFLEPEIVGGFQRLFDSAAADKDALPEPWQSCLSQFQRMLVLRCLRPDRVIPAIQTFVSEELGPHFIEPPTFNLESSYHDSSCVIPLIFVLSPGADPMADLVKFAEEARFSKKFHSISLGQGQGPRAEAIIHEACERGYWVCLQNCHLAPSWMARLEMVVESFTVDKVHRDFRLWLTSMPSSKFPVSVLQNAVKMTNEPPKGLRSNLLRTYNGFGEPFLQTSCGKKSYPWKKLLFGLCFFHAVILERRTFGPLGWNICYEFTQGDLDVCIRQLIMFINLYDEIPYRLLRFLTGHINYGGRVTDDWDRRTLMNILDLYLNPDILEDGYAFCGAGGEDVYASPPAEGISQYISYIRALPLNDTPDVFGLHSNANIMAAQNETNAMFKALLFQPERGPGQVAAGFDEALMSLAEDIMRRLPKALDYSAAEARYPVKYEESMNTVLLQEIIRFNRLLSRIHQSLQDLEKALKGLVVMSGELEQMSFSLYNNLVPEIWEDVAYPSLKPLGAWVQDLIQRLTFVNKWVDEGIPKVFWLSGFFFPQAFLTGTLQNYARKYQISIDTVSFAFEVMSGSEADLPIPTDGCYVRGLFLEGAGWDSHRCMLAESQPKDLFVEFPIVWLKPMSNREVPTAGIYECPVYKTLRRAGVLSTTGHSTNYVTTFEIPSEQPASHWIRRGVALLCALNY